MNNQLPKWMDLTTQERHKLLGELIDAMIYSGHAVEHLQVSVEIFRELGYVKSIIMSEEDFTNYTNYNLNENND